MPGNKEPDLSLEEQLNLDDGALAIMGVSRALEQADKEVIDAHRNIRTTRNYQPTPPGPAPDSYAGGMDHQDWRVVQAEYEDYDPDEEADRAENRADEAQERYDDIYGDLELIKFGDDETVGGYANKERERIRKELEKQKAAAESKERWAIYEKGAFIDGADEVYEKARALADDSELTRGKVSLSGWKFTGKARHGNALMFSRVPVIKEGVSYTRDTRATELLTIHPDGINADEGIVAVGIEYSRADNVNEDAADRYGKDLADVEYYGCEINPEGIVGKQKHDTGRPDTHLPNHMDNGHILSHIRSTHNPSTTPEVMNSTDVAKLYDKVTEVAAAMDEIARTNK